jgi:small subunit ribosomal protein S7e
VIKRKITSKWSRTALSQKRPRAFCLTSVFDATLEDMLAPAHITGKRIRCRIDGSRFFKIQLDAKDKDFMERRVDTIAQLYKKITTRDVTFDFKAEQTFYEIKK